MISIVITGGIGSGKSLACAYIEQLGYKLIYADEIARSMTMSGGEAIDEIAKTFGVEYVLPDGGMDRNKMRELVYSNAEAMDMLQNITTYATKHKIDQIIKDSNEEIVFIEVPLLFELNGQDDYDYSWLITADLDIRISRIAKRDGLNSDEALAIINSQMPEKDKIKLADEIIYNNGTAEELYYELDQLLSKYKFTIS